AAGGAEFPAAGGAEFPAAGGAEFPAAGGAEFPAAGGAFDIEPLENIAWFAAKRLVECYERNRRPGWRWFESRMTYANAVLPHALFVAAQRWPKEPFLEVASASFDFLDS